MPSSLRTLARDRAARTVALFTLAFVATLCALYIVLHVTVQHYGSAHTLNAGVVVGWRGAAPGPVQCFGLEYRGTFGPFVNVDC